MNKNNIKDIIEIQLDPFVDHRGEIYTFWKKNNFIEDLNFVHDKFTMSHKNVLRGIHGDHESTKYVTCVYGELFYVFVDYRKDSNTYLQWDSVILSQCKKNAILFPPGVGSAALTLSETSITSYKLFYPNDYPDVKNQFSIKWNDPRLNIEWPCEKIILSDRDE
jgi:dTDP-4-dehydrorhamnose 3,5-epimerase